MPCFCNELVCSFCIEKARENLKKKMEQEGYINILDSDEDEYSEEKNEGLCEKSQPSSPILVDLSTEEDENTGKSFDESDAATIIEDFKRQLAALPPNQKFGPQRIPPEALFRSTKKRIRNQKIAKEKRKKLLLG